MSFEGLGAFLTGRSVLILTSLADKPNSLTSLSLTSSSALGLISIPIHFLPSFSDAMQAVAHPQNGSKTTDSELSGGGGGGGFNNSF